MPKYVVSSTLDRADWTNTTIISGDLPTEVSKLLWDGQNLLMYGFGPVAQTLRLVRTRTFTSGLVVLVYRPIAGSAA